MSKDINLITYKIKVHPFYAKLVHIGNRIAMIFLGCIVVCAVVFYYLNTHSDLILLTYKEKVVYDNLSTLQKKIVKLLLIRNRLYDVNKELATRVFSDDRLTNLLAILPQDTHVDSLNIDKKSVNLTLSSLYLTTIETFFSNITEKVHNKEIKKVVIDTVNDDQISKKYILSLHAFYE